MCHDLHPVLSSHDLDSASHLPGDILCRSALARDKLLSFIRVHTHLQPLGKFSCDIVRALTGVRVVPHILKVALQFNLLFLIYFGSRNVWYGFGSKSVMDPDAEAQNATEKYTKSSLIFVYLLWFYPIAPSSCSRFLCFVFKYLSKRMNWQHFMKRKPTRTSALHPNIN